MVKCEFSGEETNSLIKVEIAGAVMNVAPKYANLGTLIKSNTNDKKSSSSNAQKIIPKNNTPRFKKSRVELRVVDNASLIIQSYISKNNLTIKHICHNANVKEGSLQKMLSGKIQFDIKMAQQIEKTFKLPLTQEVEINEEETIDSQDYLVDGDDIQNNSMENLMRGVMKDLKK